MPIGDLYDAILDEDAYAALPSVIAELIGGRSCVIQRFASDGALADFQTSYFSPGVVSDFVTRIPDGLDVWTRAGIAGSVRNQALALDDLVPEAIFRQSTLWNDVFRWHGDDTGHSVGLILDVPDAMLCISSHRAFSAGAFGAAEVAALDGLRADLLRVYQARDLIHQRDRRIADLTTLLDIGESCALLVGSNLELIEASPAARVVVAANDGIGMSERRLTLANAKLEAMLRVTARATIACTAVERTTFLCERPSGRPPWRLRVLPTGRQAARTCVS